MQCVYVVQTRYFKCCFDSYYKDCSNWLNLYYIMMGVNDDIFLVVQLFTQKCFPELTINIWLSSVCNKYSLSDQEISSIEPSNEIWFRP